MKTFLFALIGAIIGYIFKRYNLFSRIGYSIQMGFFSVYGALIYRPKIRRMEKYLRKNGWYQPRLNKQEGGTWVHPDWWAHDDFKNKEGWNKEGYYVLYGAYEVQKQQHKLARR